MADAIKRATRAAYGETLCELVDEGMDIISMEADLGEATNLMGFAKAHPDRFVDVGIAEQNMMGMAAGLALAGKTVFTGSFAVFGTGRCYDQIRNTVCDSGLNVKVCPTHAGVTVGEDGATHQALEDIGMMRALPQMRVLVPADFNATKAALRLAAAEDGPFYVRMGRLATEAVHGEDFAAEVGRAYVMRPGTDVTLLACGIEVGEAMRAAEALEAEGISAEVIDVFSVKPLDEVTILASVCKTGRVVTCEEHSVATGMGAAVASLLGERNPCRLRQVGMRTFGTSASGELLLKHFGLDAAAIAQAARSLMA